MYSNYLSFLSLLNRSTKEEEDVYIRMEYLGKDDKSDESERKMEISPRSSQW